MIFQKTMDKMNRMFMPVFFINLFGTKEFYMQLSPDKEYIIMKPVKDNKKGK